jgi:hypothetical protein
MAFLSKHIKLIFSLFTFVLCLFAFGQGTWTQKADVPSLLSGPGDMRQSAIGFSIGTKGYVGYGYDPASGSKMDFWEYEPSSDIWTQKAGITGISSITSAICFSTGTKGYVGTGLTADSLFWEYDPGSNVWTQKKYFGGGKKHGAVGFSISNKGYVGIGNDGSIYKKDFWEYDPSSDTWTQKADFSGPVRGVIGFSIGNKGYVGMGGDGFSYFNDFWEYNPISNGWTQKASFPGNGRGGPVGFSIGLKGYFGLGIDNTTTYYNDFWEYDPSSDSWTLKANFGGTARGSAVGFCIANKGYAGDGIASYGTYHQFWEFDPAGVGIEEPQEKMSLRIFPNPFRQFTNVMIMTKTDIFFDLVIIDLSGKEIRRIKNINSNHVIIFRESMNAGVYFIKIINSRSELFAVQKIILE